MNKVALYPVLQKKFDEFRDKDFANLRSLVGYEEETTGKTSEGMEFTLVTKVYWTDKTHESVTVSCLADDRSAFRFQPYEERIRLTKPNKAQHHNRLTRSELNLHRD